MAHKNIDITQTKSWRIDGNRGVKLVSNKTSIYSSVNASIDEEKVLTHTMPDLWFTQIQHLNTALKEHGINLPVEKLLEMQSLLFLLYQIEADRYLNAEQVYSIPTIFGGRPDDENYPSLIASLERALRPEAGNQ